MSLALTLLLAAAAAPPVIVEAPDAFPPLVNPECSHCVDEAKRRANDLKPDDPVLIWTRGYSDGGLIPVRFFLAKYRVISDSYGVFVHDPDAGFVRGFAPGYTFRFHGWRNGVMVMKDERDGTIYSCLSGRAVAGPKLGTTLATVPTVTGTWGDWQAKYPNAVAYHMFEKYQAADVPTAANPAAAKAAPVIVDSRLPAKERVLGVWTGKTAKAYPLAKFTAAGFIRDTLDGQPALVIHDGAGHAAAYRLTARQPRKYVAPRPDTFGVSPPNPGKLPAGVAELPPLTVTVEGRAANGGTVPGEPGGPGYWDIAGRMRGGALDGWTLDPLDAVAVNWLAWAAEYPETTIHQPAAEKPKPKKPAMKEIAGTAEFLRLLPKPWATVQSVDPAARTVTLLLDGEKVAKVWPVEPDAEIKVAGWWGRLEQFRPGQRAWAWLKLNRAKEPVAVAMIADELTEWDMHASLNEGAKPAVDVSKLDARRTEQRAWLRAKWLADGLPGQVAFAHVFSGELDLMLDHEAMRWGRGLKTGDAVTLAADVPIKAVVKHVSPWRERTLVRVVVGELAAAPVAAGRRIGLVVPAPSAEVESSPYPPDIDRPRTPADRAEWFLASTYCVCGVGKDICTGMFYTLASCNPNGCGAPQAVREDIADWIKKGMTDRQIWDAMLADRGRLMTTPHLRP